MKQLIKQSIAAVVLMALLPLQSYAGIIYVDSVGRNSGFPALATFTDMGVVDVYTGTDSDGALWCFLNIETQYPNIVGVKSDAQCLTLPDSLYYKGKVYTITELDFSHVEDSPYAYDNGQYGFLLPDDRYVYLDMSQAPNLTSLRVPASYDEITTTIPTAYASDRNVSYYQDGCVTQIDTLHVEKFVPVHYQNADVVAYASKIKVIQATANCVEDYRNASYYYGADNLARDVLILEEGKGLNDPLTINLSKEDDVAKKIAEACDSNFNAVHQLKLTGHLNLYYNGPKFVDLMQLVKLDMSECEVTAVWEEYADNLFRDLRNLEEVVFPENYISNIGQGSFSKCYRLRKVNIPKTVTTIGNEAFWKSGIEGIDIPETVTEIGDYAFRGCPWLKSLVIPKGVTTLKDFIVDCWSLTSVEIKSTTLTNDSYIGCNGCDNLQKIICHSFIPPTLKTDYSNHDADSILLNQVDLYVPAVSLDAYKNSAGEICRNIYPIDEEPTEVLDLAGDLTITDGSALASDCEITLEAKDYSAASLTYRGTIPVKMSKYTQQHAVSYYGTLTCSSLIADGPMEANSVETDISIERADQWYLISFPYDVKVADIKTEYPSRFHVRHFDAGKMAAGDANAWAELTSDDVMNANEGYMIMSDYDDVSVTFPAASAASGKKTFETGNATIALAEHESADASRKSWNLIGNPYPCYYDMSYMDYSGPYIVWKDGKYRAYSTVDDDPYVLSPTESIILQRSDKTPSLSFSSEGRQPDNKLRTKKESEVKGLKAEENRARTVYDFSLEGDVTRLVINENATSGYDIGTDALKFVASDNISTLIYTVQDGVRYAINERPLGNGLISLGIYSPSNYGYWLQVKSGNGDNMYIIDTQEADTALLSGYYRLNSNGTYNDTRYKLFIGDLETLTGISEITGDGSSTQAAVYALDGRYVGTYKDDESLNSLEKGLYIVKQNGKSRKVIIK